MAVGCARADIVDARTRHAKLPRDKKMAFRRIAYCSNFFIGEFCFFSALEMVLQIFSLRSPPQMIRSDARLMIAGMECNHVAMSAKFTDGSKRHM